MKLTDIFHVLVGLLAGALNLFDPLISLQLVLLFVSYQLLEQLRKRDRGWRDVLEFSVGWFAGVIIALALS